MIWLIRQPRELGAATDFVESPDRPTAVILRAAPKHRPNGENGVPTITQSGCQPDAPMCAAPKQQMMIGLGWTDGGTVAVRNDPSHDYLMYST